MNKQLTLLSAAIFATTQVVAEEAAEANTWKASAELGYVSTSGNTETDTLNAKLQGSTESENWRNEGNITALKSSTSDITTAEKYTLTLQSNYKLESPNFLFGNFNYEDEKFSGYDYRATVTVGYGRRIIEDDAMILDLEIGPGVRRSKLDLGETDNETIVRGAAKYNWKISKTSEFSEVFTVEAGEDVTVLKSVTGLSSQINGSLSMKFTYTIKDTSEVPVGIDETDTETAVTLVYKF